MQAVIGQIYARTADIKDATIFALAPGMIPGYGMGNALDLNVQNKLGTDVNTFFQTTQQYLGALNQRPEVSMACLLYTSCLEICCFGNGNRLCIFQ